LKSPRRTGVTAASRSLGKFSAGSSIGCPALRSDQLPST
jgi:hypothetical protein